MLWGLWQSLGYSSSECHNFWICTRKWGLQSRKWEIFRTGKKIVSENSEKINCMHRQNIWMVSGVTDIIEETIVEVWESGKQNYSLQHFIKIQRVHSFPVKLKTVPQMGIVLHTFYPSTQEAEAGRVWVQGQLGLQNSRTGWLTRVTQKPCLKRKNNNKGLKMRNCELRKVEQILLLKIWDNVLIHLLILFCSI